MTNATENPVLLERYFNYIDPSICRQQKTYGFNQYVTFDKFCASTRLGNTNLASDRIDKGINFTVIIVLFYCLCESIVFICVQVKLKG